MKSASDILDDLCTRGPWTVSVPGLPARELTGDDIRACYEAIRDGRDYAMVLGTSNRSDRRVDRAVQLLRGAGLVEYAGTPKRWRVKA